MDFDLSDEQVALKDAVMSMLERERAKERARELADADLWVDADLWKKVVAQGWHLVAVPEDRGGVGLGVMELAILAEQASRQLAPVPVVGTALTAHALAYVGADGPLSTLAEGGIGCIGRSGEFTLDAPVADVGVVLGDGVWVIDMRDDAVVERVPCLDPMRSLGRVRQPRIGEEVGDADAARVLADRAAVVYSASILGACAAVLEMSTEYAKVREQFGRPIGSFQAIKHRLADMYVDLEGMRAATYYAAWAVDVDAEDGSTAASAAKAWCSEAGPRLMANGLQVHGGVGFTWEHDLHFYLKRTEVDARVFGDDAYHRDRLVSELTGVSL